MFRFSLPAALAMTLTTAATAQDAPATILVLDGSGSMWGQIDGTAKITIAQQVVRDVLGTLSDDQALGLTVYGHREKGNCADIETLVAPAQGTRQTIAAAVGGISPKGKTPLSDAVIAAAEALKYTEAPATVILVSDGRETCEADPCAVARRLEELGVNFTAHVVGFDVQSDPEAAAQLQCVADETGGRYLDAGNAAELGAALSEVAQAEPVETTPDPAPEPVILTAPETAPAGSFVTVTLEGPGDGSDFISVYNAAGEAVAQRSRTLGDAIDYQMPTEPGAYEIRVLSKGRADQITARRSITLTELVPSLNAPDAVAAGSTLSVEWVGPGTEWDFLTIAKPDAGGGYSTASDYLPATGNPATIAVPSEPGTYELRYIYGTQREVLVMRPLTVN